MFRHWLDLETKANEWNEAARVAEMAMRGCPENKEFVQFAGYVYSRLAQDVLRTSLDRESARSHFRRSARLFWDTLKGPVPDELASRAFRGLCIVAQYEDDRGLAVAALREWRRRLPADTQLDLELQRARESWPEIDKELERDPGAPPVAKDSQAASTAS